MTLLNLWQQNCGAGVCLTCSENDSVKEQYLKDNLLFHELVYNLEVH